MNVPGKSSGYLALLDVLGFPAFVARDRDGENFDRYLQTLQEALGGPMVDPRDRVEYVVFSDSIVLTALSLPTLLRACSRLLWSMLMQGIALRGAISFGQYKRSTVDVQGGAAGVFVAGRAVLDAYEFERKQDWVGIMLTPSVVAKWPGLTEQCRLADPNEQAVRELEPRLAWAAFVQPYREIPFHTNAGRVASYDGFAVIPTNGLNDPREVHSSLSQSVAGLRAMKLLAPDPGSQEKYTRAINWLHHVASRWQEIARIWPSAFGEKR